MARRRARREDAIKANPGGRQTMYGNIVMDFLPGGALKQAMSLDMNPHYELHYIYTYSSLHRSMRSKFSAKMTRQLMDLWKTSWLYIIN